MKVNDEVAKQILGYFVRNSNTVDSLDGIARWRLLETRVRQNVEETAQGLQLLVQQGYLDEEDVPGMTPLFRLNPKRRQEAEQALASEVLLEPDESGNR